MGVDDGDAKKFEGTGGLYAPPSSTQQGKLKPAKGIRSQGELYAPPSQGQKNAASAGAESEPKSEPEPEPELEPAAHPPEAGMISEASKDVRAALATMKDVVVDKLSSLHLPSEAIEAGRKSMENLIKEVSHTYDNAKGAVIATKDKIVSSMTTSSSVKDAGQVTKDVEDNVLDSAEGKVPDTHHSKAYRDVKASINSRL